MTRVLVIYKSGAQVEIKCDEFTVRRRNGEIAEATWKNAEPRPLFLGITEIAAVYVLGDEAEESAASVPE